MLKNKHIAAVLLTTTLLGLALILYILASAGYGQRVSFQEYKPGYLPSGLATTDGEFYVLRNEGIVPSFIKNISVNFNAPNSSLVEWESDGRLTNACSDLPYDKSCNTYTTPYGQHYQLSVNTNANTGSSIYDVRFIKGGTEIWITVRDFKKNVSVADWSKTVDSFRPGHYDGLKTIRRSTTGA